MSRLASSAATCCPRLVLRLSASPDLFVSQSLAVVGFEAVDGEIGAFDVVEDGGEVVEGELFADGAETGGDGVET